MSIATACQTPGAVFRTEIQRMEHMGGARDGNCGQRPSGRNWPACVLTEGHGSERHESHDFWWSDRQQTPVMKGHVHSTDLFCTSVCPAYRTSLGGLLR